MIVKCPDCGDVWEFDDDDIILMFPFPHYTCPHCGGMCPAF